MLCIQECMWLWWQWDDAAVGQILLHHVLWEGAAGSHVVNLCLQSTYTCSTALSDYRAPWCIKGSVTVIVVYDEGFSSSFLKTWKNQKMRQYKDAIIHLKAASALTTVKCASIFVKFLPENVFRKILWEKSRHMIQNVVDVSCSSTIRKRMADESGPSGAPVSWSLADAQHKV